MSGVVRVISVLALILLSAGLAYATALRGPGSTVGSVLTGGAMLATVFAASISGPKSLGKLLLTILVFLIAPLTAFLMGTEVYNASV